MKNISILIVEDEKELQEQLIEFIEMFIDTIYVANDGIEALELYKQYIPDIVLTDINMPKLNGFELSRHIQDCDNYTKIIMMSAYTDTEYLLKAIDMHLVSYLVKPINTSKLKIAIQKSILDIQAKNLITLVDNHTWNKKLKILYHYNKEIKLTNYEILFLECLILFINNTVSYEQIYLYVYGNQEYSKDAITSLVKRLRNKTSKSIITSSYKEGYKIYSVL